MEESHEDHQAQRLGGSFRYYQDHHRCYQSQRFRKRQEPPDPRADHPDRCGGHGPVPVPEPRGQRGRDSGYGGEQVDGHEGPRHCPPLHHLSVCPEPEAPDQHHRRAHLEPDRVPERRGQAGERQQEPHREQRSARLHGRRDLQGSDRPSAAGPGDRQGPSGGPDPLPRFRLLCPAHAQLRSGQSGRYAPERHRHLRHLY